MRPGRSSIIQRRALHLQHDSLCEISESGAPPASTGRRRTNRPRGGSRTASRSRRPGHPTPPRPCGRHRSESPTEPGLGGIEEVHGITSAARPSEAAPRSRRPSAPSTPRWLEGHPHEVHAPLEANLQGRGRRAAFRPHPAARRSRLRAAIPRSCDARCTVSEQLAGDRLLKVAEGAVLDGLAADRTLGSPVMRITGTSRSLARTARRRPSSRASRRRSAVVERRGLEALDGLLAVAGGLHDDASGTRGCSRTPSGSLRRHRRAGECRNVQPSSSPFRGASRTFRRARRRCQRLLQKGDAGALQTMPLQRLARAARHEQGPCRGSHRETLEYAGGRSSKASPGRSGGGEWSPGRVARRRAAPPRRWPPPGPRSHGVAGCPRGRTRRTGSSSSTTRIVSSASRFEREQSERGLRR